MKGELERKSTQLADANAEQMRLQSEVQHCKAEFLDAQRAERATQVDYEQVTKKVSLNVYTICHNSELSRITSDFCQHDAYHQQTTVGIPSSATTTVDINSK